MGWRDREYGRFDDYEGDIEYAELSGCKVKAATDKAILVLHECVEHWIPRSVVEDGDIFERGYLGTIMVAMWFAEREGIV